jgi:predicted ATPase
LISWYRFALQDQSFTNQLKEYLGEIFSGFSHFQFVDIGQDSIGKNNQELLLKFSNPEDARMTGYSFADLSDGERAIIALYSLLVYAKQEGYLLCLDEPENFIALAEIQPWLVELYDLCSDGSMQAILISHHPEILNYLAIEAGVWFERSESGYVVAQPVVDEADTGLPISDLVARGWIGA